MRGAFQQLREAIAKRGDLRLEHVLVADGCVDGSIVIAILEQAPHSDTVVELVAAELDLLAVVFVLDKADEVSGGQAGIVEHLEGALGREMTGHFVEPGRFFGIGQLRGQRRRLLAAPLEDVGVEEAPDRHARGLDAVAGAEVGAFLPAVAGVGRRVIEEKEQLIKEGKGLALGIPGVQQPMGK